MTQFYYRKAAAGIVVFGLDDSKSFEDVKSWIGTSGCVSQHTDSVGG